mmetsp:Transcript_130920/g.378764  ORF Transcript_130920/g.378764 Transcript_130920/m.378764 type:complete len:357 (+) Transcript_130920:710-1780(+)
MRCLLRGRRGRNEQRKQSGRHRRSSERWRQQRCREVAAINVQPIASVQCCGKRRPWRRRSVCWTPLGRRRRCLGRRHQYGDAHGSVVPWDLEQCVVLKRGVAASVALLRCYPASQLRRRRRRRCGGSLIRRLTRRAAFARSRRDAGGSRGPAAAIAGGPGPDCGDRARAAVAYRQEFGERDGSLRRGADLGGRGGRRRTRRPCPRQRRGRRPPGSSCRRELPQRRQLGGRPQNIRGRRRWCSRSSRHASRNEAPWGEPGQADVAARRRALPDRALGRRERGASARGGPRPLGARRLGAASLCGRGAGSHVGRGERIGREGIAPVCRHPCCWRDARTPGMVRGRRLRGVERRRWGAF